MDLMKRGLMFTDIHWGKKSNSAQHNDDCLRFCQWIVSEVQSLGNIDYIAFLGDWFENRININIFTIQRAFEGAELLNTLNIPIYFVIGNHDLAERNSRQVFSPYPFRGLSNFIIIDEPFVETGIVDGVLFSPFLMKPEYDQLGTLGAAANVWMGHFEFKGFVLTGTSVKLEHGPDIDAYSQPKAICSGHFHKRQSQKNVHYIGNTFPMDFGDSGDRLRGYAIYDHTNHTIQYVDWCDGPSYLSTSISQILVNPTLIPPKCHLYVDIDKQMSYDEIRIFKQFLSDKHPDLRSLEFNENSVKITELAAQMPKSDIIDSADSDVTSGSVDISNMIVNLLQKTDIPSYDNALLIQVYQGL